MNLPSDSSQAWQRSDLLGRRSLWGAIGLLVGVAFFFWLPSALDATATYSDVTPDGRIQVDDFWSLHLADGWEITSRNELFTTIGKHGVQAPLVASFESDTSSIEYAQLLADGAEENDPTLQIVEVQEFTTDSGLEGAYYVGHSTVQVVSTWVVSTGTRLAVLTAGGPDVGFEEVFQDVVDMAESIEASG